MKDDSELEKDFKRARYIYASIYFGLIMSNTLNPSYLLAFLLGFILGPPMHFLTPQWGLVLTGLITGTLAYLLRHKLSSDKNYKEVNG